jgi:hypothetical protein
VLGDPGGHVGEAGLVIADRQGGQGRAVRGDQLQRVDVAMGVAADHSIDDFGRLEHVNLWSPFRGETWNVDPGGTTVGAHL